MPQLLRALVAALAVSLLLTAGAAAFRLGPVELRPVPGNPAHALADREPDPQEYDPARRCLRTPRPGVQRLLRWLDRHAAGVSWGSYRCERWGPESASLHAEGRAIDWHLDSRDPAQRAAGKRLIRLLLAPDTAGTPQALARRMGIQELIWDCSYWSAGRPDFGPYAPCYGRDGRTRRRRVDATVGHLDHVHIGMTKAGAMARTSFWDR